MRKNSNAEKVLNEQAGVKIRNVTFPVNGRKKFNADMKHTNKPTAARYRRHIILKNVSLQAGNLTFICYTPVLKYYSFNNNICIFAHLQLRSLERDSGMSAMLLMHHPNWKRSTIKAKVYGPIGRRFRSKKTEAYKLLRQTFHHLCCNFESEKILLFILALVIIWCVFYYSIKPINIHR